MALNRSHDSFCSLLAQSGLIDDERQKELHARFAERMNGQLPESCQLFAEFLIRQNALTLWQAKKLLQGKHKGFFLGKYRLLSLLGRGGMSSVYLAEHTVMRRRSAIKVLPFKQVKNEAALGRFHREAQAVASLDHPNIVRAYDVDHVMEGSTEIHFLVMEHVEGRSLQQLVDEDGPVEFANAVEYARQAASGLIHAHESGMVHRDVKPSNLLLDENGVVKVLDLGLARMVENATEKSSLTLEHDQTVLGTADYLSPEQAVDSHSVDHRSDIYSLGCTLYFLLTGRPPFPDGTLAQRLLAHQTKSPPPISDFRPDVPSSLKSIVKGMMAKQPDERMDSMEVVAKVLAEWLHENSDRFPLTKSSSPIMSNVRRVWPSKARHPNDTTAAGFKSDDVPTEEEQSQFILSDSPSHPGDSEAAVGDFREFLSNLDSPSEQETTVPALSVSETVVSRQRSRVLGEKRTDTIAVGSQDDSTTDGPSGDTTVTHVDLHEEHALPNLIERDEDARKVPRLSNIQIIAAGVASAVLLLMVGLFRLAGDTPETSKETWKPGGDISSGQIVMVPDIEPGSDITVGPNGHFDNITAAIEYVAENFHPLSSEDVLTIRVVGGRTYEERIVFGNSQPGRTPAGVHIICEDDEPAVLKPQGNEPIVDLRNVDRFRLQGFHLNGTGQPTLVRLEGYLVSSVLAELNIEGAAEYAVQGIGVSGLIGEDRFRMENLTFRNTGTGGTAMRFEPGESPTKDLLLSGCRILGDYETGVAISGGASHVEIERCIFDGSRTPVRFTDPPEVIEYITVANCTLRSFQQGISLQRRVTDDVRRLTFSKLLFLDGSGPEVTALEPLPEGTLQASFNWSDRVAPESTTTGELDIFQENGRRGARVSVVATDDSASSTYLQPNSPDLREAGIASSGPHSFIGAVTPAGE